MSYQEFLAEILKARETDEPVDALRLQEYIAENNPRTRELLFSLFSDPATWKFAKNVSVDDREAFLLRELRFALVDKPKPPALDTGYALREITNWLGRLFAEMQQGKNPKASSRQRETASSLSRILEDAASTGNTKINDLIVTAVLEHIFASNEVAVEMFRGWREDKVLKPLFDEGLSIACG